MRAVAKLPGPQSTQVLGTQWVHHKVPLIDGHKAWLAGFCHGLIMTTMGKLSPLQTFNVNVWSILVLIVG